MRKRGWKGHHFGAKDVAVGAGPALATAALAVAVDPFAYHVADHVAQHVRHLAEAAHQEAGHVMSSAGVGTEAIPAAWVEGAVYKAMDLAAHQVMDKGTLWVLTRNERVEEE